MSPRSRSQRPPIANETGPGNGLFTVSISSPSSTDTVINYTVAGSATSGSDYTALSGSVTILAGNLTETISVPTIDDGLVEGTENVSITLTSIAAGDPQVTLGGTTAASIDLFDNDSGSWTISGDANVAESANASYTVSLSGAYQNGEDASVDLSLADVDTTSSDYADFNAAITAAVAAYSGPGTYSLVGSTLTWTATADGQTPTGLTISLNATDDATVELSEDFTVSLSSPASTTGAAVVLGASTSVTTTITDNDVATISIAATTDANEAGLVSGLFTVTMTNPSSTDTVINYTVAGSATSGNDFTALSGTVTILAGSTSATINVPVADDSLVEGTETVSVTLTGIASGDPQVAIGGSPIGYDQPV